MKENFIATLCIGACAIVSFSVPANAQNTDINASPNSYDETLFIPAVYALDNAWNTGNYDFTKPAIVPVTINTQNEGNIAEADNVPIKEGEVEEMVAFEAGDNDMGDEILKKLPFKNTLKYTWDIVDGDEDIYFEGLRVDRGNMGLEYKTQSIPMVGQVDAIRMKAEVGRSQKLTFESDYVPLVGRIDGFNFKASAGSNNRVSVRYRTDITW